MSFFKILLLSLALASQSQAKGLHFGIISATHDAAKDLKAKVDEQWALDHPAASLAPFPKEHTWYPEGAVYAMAKEGRHLYLGGSFNRFWAGTGGGAQVLSSTGKVSPGWWKVDKNIKAVVADGQGGWYIGGDFTRAGHGSRDFLARVKADGSLDSSFDAHITGTEVRTLILDGSGASASLYVGGAFSSIGGLSRSHLAKLNAATGSGDPSFEAGLGNEVFCMVLLGAGPGASLFVSGKFSSVQSSSLNYLAKLDAASGALDPIFRPQPDNWIQGMAVSDSSLYVGGSFNNISGVSRTRLAKLDTIYGAADGAFISSANARVEAIALSPAAGILYVGGQFTQVSGTARDYIAGVDTGTGEALGSFSLVTTSYVYSLALGPGGSQLYVGGLGIFAGGPQSAARVDAATGAVDGSFKPDPNGVVMAFGLGSGGAVYLGGNFFWCSSVARDNLAKVDLETGDLVESFAPDPDAFVESLASANGALYVGGYFYNISGQARTYLAKLAFSGAVDLGFNAGFSAGGAHVEALAISGNSLYAGGDFSGSRPRLAKMDAFSGALDLGFDAGADAEVFSMALSGNDLYVGGDFANIGGGAHSKIARLSASTGVAHPSFNISSDGRVTALLVSGASLYVGGEGMGSIGGGTGKANLAKLSPDTGLDDAIFGAFCNGRVRQLLLLGGQLYVGGDFGFLNGNPHYRLGRVDPGTGVRDAAFVPFNSFSTFVASLLPSGNDLFVGGYFLMLEEAYQSSFGTLNP